MAVAGVVAGRPVAVVDGLEPPVYTGSPALAPLPHPVRLTTSPATHTDTAKGCFTVISSTFVPFKPRTGRIPGSQRDPMFPTARGSARGSPASVGQ